MKTTFKVFIKEIVPIIVGILIAMYINNWNEDRKDKKYINQIFLSIKKELAETNDEIINKIPLQKSLIDSLDFYLEDTKISLIDIIIKSKGIQIPPIKMNAWKSFSNSRIELLEYDKVSILANIEEQREVFKMKTEQLATFTYSNTKETGKNKKDLMKLMMQDIIITEMSIQEYIMKFTGKNEMNNEIK